MPGNPNESNPNVMWSLAVEGMPTFGEFLPGVAPRFYKSLTMTEVNSDGQRIPGAQLNGELTLLDPSGDLAEGIITTITNSIGLDVDLAIQLDFGEGMLSPIMTYSISSLNYKYAYGSDEFVIGFTSDSHSVRVRERRLHDYIYKGTRAGTLQSIASQLLGEAGVSGVVRLPTSPSKESVTVHGWSFYELMRWFADTFQEAPDLGSRLIFGWFGPDRDLFKLAPVREIQSPIWWYCMFPPNPNYVAPTILDVMDFRPSFTVFPMGAAQTLIGTPKPKESASMFAEKMQVLKAEASRPGIGWLSRVKTLAQPFEQAVGFNETPEALAQWGEWVQGSAPNAEMDIRGTYHFFRYAELNDKVVVDIFRADGRMHPLASSYSGVVWSVTQIEHKFEETYTATVSLAQMGG